MSSKTLRARARLDSIAWKVAAVLWALVIFSMSTGGFGPSYTERVLTGVF
jgi:hypothetical protein